MGAHKGKTYKDKGSKTRYWSENHRRDNKIRRITTQNGLAFLEKWKAKFAK